MFPDLGNDIFPGRYRDHVAGIAAEAIHSPLAPGEKNFCHVTPEFPPVVIKPGQIRPGDSPGSGNFNPSFLVPDQPFGMGGMNKGAPARMIGGDIDEQGGLAGMDGINQFTELFQRGGFGVENRQGWIHRGEIECCIRAAETAHAGKRGRGRIDGQQLDDLTAQGADNEIQLSNQIAKGAGRGNDGVLMPVQVLDAFFFA